MLFLDQKIESIIVESLRKGACTTHELIDTVSKIRGTTTKQAVYAALRQLTDDEIVIKRGKVVLLNSLWLSKLWKFAVEGKESLGAETHQYEPVLALEEGDVVTYSFRNLDLLDRYWAHIFELLLDHQPQHEPVYLYNPHEWFLVARVASESQLFQKINDEQRLVLFTIGGKTKIDHAIARKWRSNHIKFSCGLNPLKVSERTYINVFGDTILEVKLDAEAASAIEEWYDTYDRVTGAREEELQRIITRRGRTRMKVYRNAKKAKQLRKKLAKNFHIPKEYQNH